MNVNTVADQCGEAQVGLASSSRTGLPLAKRWRAGAFLWG
jgi:hypothetical protein